MVYKVKNTPFCEVYGSSLDTLGHWPHSLVIQRWGSRNYATRGPCWTQKQMQIQKRNQTDLVTNKKKIKSEQ